MELIVISESKLKIMLSAPDMAYYELDPEELGQSHPHGRRAFRHLLADCVEEIGFDTEGERLLVQLYASKDGGCEIFVTKMGQAERSDFDHLTEGELALRSRIFEDDLPFSVLPNIDTNTLTNGEGEERWCIFHFDDLQSTIAACRRLRSVGRTGGSCYMAEDGSILLRLLLPLSLGHRLHPSVAFLHEYGQELAKESTELYIGEHAHSIVKKQAVLLLSTF